ncbi:MAG TPA: Rossmann-like and DUF2520 domain-containing protein [Thermoanaerobaculia bacterium]|nr:Rossmann-like and DUF2520 domain-containing protein [Thermoanaerobaculia bacterium]
MKLTFSVAGPGRVGTSLTAWLESLGARRIGMAGRQGLADLSSGGQDLLLVAVSDPALPEVAAVLARRPQAAVALHTSGCLDASVLAPLREAGSAVGSLHPLKAFPRPLPEPAEAKGVFFAVDGDPAARELAHRLAAAWGGISAEVASESRALYHFAATLAAGGAITLLALAEDLARRLGLPEAAVRGYLELCRGAVARAIETGDPAAVLTGPVARGDRETVTRHLEALRTLAPDKLPLVVHLARETLRQKERLGELTREQRELLAALVASG